MARDFAVWTTLTISPDFPISPPDNDLADYAMIRTLWISPLKWWASAFIVPFIDFVHWFHLSWFCTFNFLLHWVCQYVESILFAIFHFIHRTFIFFAFCFFFAFFGFRSHRKRPSLTGEWACGRGARAKCKSPSPLPFWVNGRRTAALFPVWALLTECWPVYMHLFSIRLFSRFHAVVAPHCIPLFSCPLIKTWKMNKNSIYWLFPLHRSLPVYVHDSWIK